jgi:hypothetical protein
MPSPSACLSPDARADVTFLTKVSVSAVAAARAL